MKKILFFMFALLAVVACDDMWGGVEDSTPADVAGDVSIEFSAVTDTSFTVTITPTKAASYYSYLVDDEGVDLSDELDAETIYECGYSSVAAGTVKYSDNPSYTFTITAEEPNLTYYVYAVAGSPEGNVGEICAKSVTTTYVPVYEVYVSADYDDDESVVTATVEMTDDVESVRVAVVEGKNTEDDIEAALDAVLDGTVDYKTVTASGKVQFSVTEDGSYIVMAVAYGGGEAQDFDYDIFKVDHSGFVSLGMCTYRDDYMASYYFGMEESCFEYEVEIQERESTPGLFRLVNPYGADYPIHNEESWNTFWTYWTYYWYGINYNLMPWDELEEGQPYDDSQDYYIEIDASDPDGVFIDMQNTGMDYGDGWIYVYSFASYYMDNGYTLDQVKNYGYCGTYENGVITFPVDALLMYEPGYNPSSYYYANDFGMFRVILPGSVPTDYSVDIEYNGRLVDTRDRNYAVATVTLGEDVEYALVAMVEGDDYEAAIEAIKAGTVSCQTITKSGGVEFANEESGIFTIAVVSYGGGVAQKSAYVTFTYTVGSTAEWNLYGTGDYLYSGFMYIGFDTGLELYQSSSNPSLFKIEHWAADVDFYFTWDQDTNEIVVDEQVTGETYSSYGDIYVNDLSVDYSTFTYYGPTGYYENGVFYFAVDYYCTAGDFGHGYEYFALEGATVGVPVSDIPGSYYAYEYNAPTSQMYGGEYVLAASDDSSKGNIMFTVFDDVECDIANIYGTYDEETGIAEFDNDQIYSTMSGYYLGARLYSYYSYYPVTFLFFNDGSFWGPFYGDYLEIGGFSYNSQRGRYTHAGYFYAYEYLYAFPYSSGPGSIAPASKSDGIEKHVAEPTLKNEFKNNQIKTTKGQVKKPERVELEDGIVLASSSMRPTGDNSSNGSNKGVSKDVRKGTQKSVEARKNSSKESIKDAIKQSKGMNN